MKTASSKAVDALYKLAKKKLPIALEAKFAEFPLAIIETHGKDLTVSTESSRTGTPIQTATGVSGSRMNNTAAPSPPVKSAEVAAINTTTITVDATFMASADDLFSILTDENRIPMWSRAPAKVC